VLPCSGQQRHDDVGLPRRHHADGGVATFPNRKQEGSGIFSAHELHFGNLLQGCDDFLSCFYSTSFEVMLAALQWSATT
jgi:hypothetical protein